MLEDAMGHSKRLRLTLLATAGLCLHAAGNAYGDLADDGAFEQRIAPVIARNCLNCHNPTDLKGGLDLTEKSALVKGGKSGPVIVPGKADESYLIERVTEGSMPPKGKGRRLAANEVAALRDWVRAGAHWPDKRVLSPFEFTSDRRAGYDWWSLQPLTLPSPPGAAGQTAHAENDVDRFVVQKLQERGLLLAPPADKVTYIRRATFDLLGLPPTPQEIDAFVADHSPDAY